MSTTISSATTPQLDSSYISMINSLMTIERQPLTRMTTQQNDLATRTGMYSDIQRMLTAMQSATKAMISTDPSYAFTPARSAQVNTATGQTVMTASAGANAPVASFSMHVNKLATTHQALSNKQSISMTTALVLSGDILVGGAGGLSNTTALAGTVDGFTASAGITKGQTELGSGDYTVATQKVGDTLQFRLVDASGTAVSISDGAGGFSSDWQNMPTASGSFDTGRGLSINLGANSTAVESTQGSNAAHVIYTAGRASVNIATGDSLVDVASKINHAGYASGKEVVASVIGGQLVLNAKQTGTANRMSLSDSTGSVFQSLGVTTAGGALKTERAPTDASIVVNDLDPIIRSSNTGLTDVIAGVTLNLAGDAEGKDATVNVQANTNNEKTTLNSFIQNFNSLSTYLNGKLATVKNGDGTYTRGSLAGDGSMLSLKTDLLRMVNADAVNGGTLKNLTQIGLSLDDKFQLQVTDQSKLQDALTNNKNNVVKLVDAVMNKVNAKVGRFTGKSGIVTTMQNSLTQQTKDITARIAQMNERLDAKQATLYTQFATAQNSITEMTYTSKMLGAFYSTSA
jgi:flagellar capping protein FliD